TDTEDNTPTVTPITTPVGTLPPATDGIGNEDTFPPGTTVEWQTPPDVSVPGETTGTVIVTYPDGTTDE
ncbi:Rib/alpha-like domain-containing protein, partial [Macrococcoides bohemicum]